jgi:hypothetical protein
LGKTQPKSAVNKPQKIETILEIKMSSTESLQQNKPLTEDEELQLIEKLSDELVTLLNSPC